MQVMISFVFFLLFQDQGKFVMKETKFSLLPDYVYLSDQSLVLKNLINVLIIVVRLRFWQSSGLTVLMKDNFFIGLHDSA